MNADELCCHECVFNRTPPPAPPTLDTAPQLPHPGSLAHQNGRKSYSTSSSSHLPKAVPAQGPRSRLQRQTEHVPADRRWAAAASRVVFSSRVGHVSPCFPSYSLRNVSLIVLHNPNLLCPPTGPIVPLIKSVLVPGPQRAPAGG